MPAVFSASINSFGRSSGTRKAPLPRGASSKLKAMRLSDIATGEGRAIVSFATLSGRQKANRTSASRTDGSNSLGDSASNAAPGSISSRQP